MKKTAAIPALLSVVLVLGIAYMLFSGSGNEDAQPGNTSESSQNLQSTANPTANVTVKDNVQYVTLTAKGGYSPEVSIAKADMPTKLIMKTNGTYDCSLALVVRSAGYRGMLPSTWETTVDLGSPKPGENLSGNCSMGMYGFSIKFR
jgi:uncharacterized protein